MKCRKGLGAAGRAAGGAGEEQGANTGRMERTHTVTMGGAIQTTSVPPCSSEEEEEEGGDT